MSLSQSQVLNLRIKKEQIQKKYLYLSGLLVAQQSISRPPLLVAQMTEEWLNYYRKIAQSSNPTQSRAGGQNNSMINWYLSQYVRDQLTIDMFILLFVG